MKLSSLTVDVEDGFGRLTFTQGPRGNPVDGQACADLRAAAHHLAATEGLRVLLISAEGKAFSYGGDIAAFVADLDRLPRLIEGWAADLSAAIVDLQSMSAPIVAAVHGVCAGGMAAFVAGADVVVASDDAQFVAAYGGIGYCCDAGASVMLTRRMGLARARRYLVLNETLAADAALACGLVDETVARDALLERAEQLARKIAAGPTFAFGEMRRLLLSAEDQPLAAQLSLEAAALVRSTATADAREGLLAFSERRKPVFAGR